MKSSHRFPLRRQIVWGMRFFTILTSLAVGAALFTLSNQYVRANSLQAAEFNLRLVATSIETSLESADALLNWASIDSTVRRYISQENINGTQTIAAYEAMQEKYYSSTLYSHILRFFVTNENDRHLQFGPLNSSAALNRTSVKQFLTKGYGMQFATDPLLPGSPSCIAISQPVRCGKGTLHRGSTYLALDTAIITDPAAGYSLTDGSALYWEMGSRLWQIENGSLTEIENPLREVDYTLRTGSNNGVTEQTAWQGKVQLDGQKYYVVKVTLNGRSAALVQLLPANTFLLHYGVYLWLVALGTAIIWGLSFLMQHWLERVITRPVEALQKRIETVGSGNFAPDRTVEWNNELGDIGRGINQLAENVDSLMTRRVEDERRKQELEYRMLQNEVNPHFIYNTLNSIRWMATIQQYRYGGDLEIEVSRIESETLCRDCMIPRFTLQPLVENAIFHGLEPKGGHGSVLLDISTDPDTGDVLLRITDDGVGMPPEQVAHLLDEPAEGAEKAEKFRHVGLWNVNRRIRYSFGEGYGLTIESEEDVGTEVTIRLPYQQKGDTHAADITGG
ncbi:sensor histidine kinase [Faecalibacterium intestinale]|uniref:ATP-binding protein n=1 Tax=Faecalibacterium intestinale TaxID=3133155 RepID=A0ABV1C5K9_9FIRM